MVWGTWSFFKRYWCIQTASGVKQLSLRRGLDERQPTRPEGWERSRPPPEAWWLLTAACQQQRPPHYRDSLCGRGKGRESSRFPFLNAVKWAWALSKANGSLFSSSLKGGSNFTRLNRGHKREDCATQWASLHLKIRSSNRNLWYRPLEQDGNSHYGWLFHNGLNNHPPPKVCWGVGLGVSFVRRSGQRALSLTLHCTLFLYVSW